MRILKLFTLLCILFLYTAQSLAQQNVDTVYRIDSRPPQQIFILNGGFHPWGTNADLAEHIQDYSLGTNQPAEGSAFVATTSNEEQAIEWGVMMSSSSEERFYVYNIRPTANFYSVVLSLQSFYARTGDRRYLELLNTYEEQKEYAAFNGISVTQIRRVDVYEYDPNRGDYGRTSSILNPLYQEVQTTANGNPFSQLPQLPREIVTPATYCAMNMTHSHHYSASLAASTKTRKFIKELSQCNASLSIMAFLYTSFF
ncbi:scabin-related ADP-ribosyltransferase [Xenorhabdus miraniensis]|uniref:Pertussis toxin subunit 1 n=1 Tax=Xenorhabdus miraniensis TaxID=351674 RepID=A0A2D0JMU6_9GAMM|nr:enterotoxin A family protein [Xenorhabdus miraniensis]PHM47581.1 pertussis toxin subunit 1 precursor [Xenorhabdus miraniensis]